MGGIFNFFFGDRSERGMDGEADMTENDWLKRGGDQARAMLQGDDALNSSPNEQGQPTGGDYNGDYPQSWHDECNQRLDDDEYYEANVGQNLQELRRLLEEQ